MVGEGGSDGGAFPVIWDSLILLTDKSYKDYIMLVQGMGVKSEEGGSPRFKLPGGGSPIYFLSNLVLDIYI